MKNKITLCAFLMTECAYSVCKLCNILGCYPDCDCVSSAALEDFWNRSCQLFQVNSLLLSISVCVCDEKNVQPRGVKNNKSIETIVAEP